MRLDHRPVPGGKRRQGLTTACLRAVRLASSLGMNGAEAVFTNLVCMARADRVLGQAEAELLDRYREALGIRSPDARKILARRVLQPILPEEAQPFPSESLAHLRMLIRLAAADGEIHRRERALIETVAESLGVGPLHLADLEVESGGQVGARRRLRVAKLIGGTAIVLAIVLSLWAPTTGHAAARSTSISLDRAELIVAGRTVESRDPGATVLAPRE